MRSLWTCVATGAAVLAASGCSSFSGVGSYAQDALQDWQSNREACQGVSDPAREAGSAASAVAEPVTYRSSMNRAQACQRFYRAVSAGAIQLDAGASALSGVGALGLIGAGGRAVQSTTNAFGALAVAPLVLRDVVNQSPQAALARQAGEAVELAQCHADQLHFAAQSLESERARLRTSLAVAQTTLNNLDAMIDARFQAIRGQPNADGVVEEQALADVLVRDRQLQEMIRFAGVMQDSILAGVQLDGAMEAEANNQTGLEARIAQRLDLRLDIINRTWADGFIGLAPTPDQTVRSILAAPLNATANLIAGQSQAPSQQVAVEQALYDFSAARMSFGAGAQTVNAPSTRIDLTLFEVADWPELREYQAALTALTAAIDRAASQVNGIAALDVRMARGRCSLEDPITP